MVFCLTPALLVSGIMRLFNLLTVISLKPLSPIYDMNFKGAFQILDQCAYQHGMLWDSIIIIVARRVVRKLFKRFPLFQGNTDMLDNVMDFSPRDKNKLIFSSSTTTIQDSLSIYKWVHIGAKINLM